jgi:hypothetical protein
MVYAVDTASATIYTQNVGANVRTVERSRLRVPVFSFQRPSDLNNIAVSVITAAAQESANTTRPPIYAGESPLEVLYEARRVLESENVPFHAILLHPSYLRFVDGLDDDIPCYVHDDAPAGAVLYLPDPAYLGVVSVFENVAAIHVRGPIATILTDPSSRFRNIRHPMVIPTQVKPKAPVPSDPQYRDVWRHLEDDDLF